MVIGKLTGYLALGLIGAFLINTLIRPGAASATGGALQETGAGIGAIGQGIGESLAAIGRGGASLFQPLWELKNLIYDTNVSGAASVGPVAQHELTTNVVSGATNPSASTYTVSDGTAITTSFGTITGGSPGSVWSFLGGSSANPTGHAGGPLGAAHAAGYSTGSA
jgi:hypothetical protein